MNHAAMRRSCPARQHHARFRPIRNRTIRLLGRLGRDPDGRLSKGAVLPCARRNVCRLAFRPADTNSTRMSELALNEEQLHGTLTTDLLQTLRLRLLQRQKTVACRRCLPHGPPLSESCPLSEYSGTTPLLTPDPFPCPAASTRWSGRWEQGTGYLHLALYMEGCQQGTPRHGRASPSPVAGFATPQQGFCCPRKFCPQGGAARRGFSTSSGHAAKPNPTRREASLACSNDSSRTPNEVIPVCPAQPGGEPI